MRVLDNLCMHFPMLDHRLLLPAEVRLCKSLIFNRPAFSPILVLQPHFKILIKPPPSLPFRPLPTISFELHISPEGMHARVDATRPFILMPPQLS